MVRLSVAVESLEMLGYQETLRMRLCDLAPKQVHVVKLSAAVASKHGIVLLDSPLEGLDQDQKAMVVNMISQQQTKAIVLTINSKSDLELLGSCKNLCLDDLSISDQPYLRLTFHLLPLLDDEV
mmetsp:Transcript_24371/g.32636  ORF Transcript_24371/g.32636 Transcript_24371/m.32636 type:complete len:124 (-) Transcript_24371:331-702(-)